MRVQKQLGFVFRRAPHGTIHVQELLDIVLIGAAFDQAVRVYFLDDGVWCLQKQQQPEGIGLKQLLPVFDVLDMYGVTELWVDQQSLRSRGLSEADLALPVRIQSRRELMQSLAQSDHVLSA